MGLLEDALREAFAEQVRASPAVEDAAGQAIGAAGRIRRRRAVAGAVALMASVALASGGVVAFRSSSGPSAGGPPSVQAPNPLPLDVRTRDAIVTADGRVISLAPLAPILDAFRVTDGWLVVRVELHGRSLHHVDPRGKVTLVMSAAGLAVSADGARVAWTSGSGVSLGRRDGAVLTTTQHTPGTGSFRPIGFAGGGVVLASDAAYPTRHEVWYPSRGKYTPGPRTEARILAPTADGSGVFALVATYPCLVELRPDAWATVHRACDLDLREVRTLLPSPDGRWLLALGSDRVDLYDLARVWTVQEPIAWWTVAAHDAAWVGRGSFVLNGPGELLRGYVDAPERLDEIPVDAVDGEDVIPVATMGRP